MHSFLRMQWITNTSCCFGCIQTSGLLIMIVCPSCKRYPIWSKPICVDPSGVAFSVEGTGAYCVVHSCGNVLCNDCGMFYECDRSCEQRYKKQRALMGLFRSRKSLSGHLKKYHCASMERLLDQNRRQLRDRLDYSPSVTNLVDDVDVVDFPTHDVPCEVY